MSPKFSSVALPVSSGSQSTSLPNSCPGTLCGSTGLQLCSHVTYRWLGKLETRRKNETAGQGLCPILSAQTAKQNNNNKQNKTQKKENCHCHLSLSLVIFTCHCHLAENLDDFFPQILFRNESILARLSLP